MKTSIMLICFIVLLSGVGCKITKTVTVNEVPEYKDIKCLILRTPDGKFFLSSYEFKDEYLEGVLVKDIDDKRKILTVHTVHRIDYNGTLPQKVKINMADIDKITYGKNSWLIPIFVIVALSAIAIAIIGSMVVPFSP